LSRAKRGREKHTADSQVEGKNPQPRLGLTRNFHQLIVARRLIGARNAKEPGIPDRIPLSKSRHDYAPGTFVCKQENFSARLSLFFPRTPAIFPIVPAFCYGTHPFFHVPRVPVRYSASDVPNCPAT
jgi:hypothetical protein